MRWGLFLLGAGLAALGASLCVLGVLSYPESVMVKTTETSSITIPGGSSGSFSLTNASGSGGQYTSLSLHLDASNPIALWVGTCPFAGQVPPSCVIAENTTPSRDPSIVISSPHLPYVVVVHVPGNSSSYVSMSAVLSSKTTQGLPLWEEVVVLAGAIVLLAGGSLAIFLGLFLRGNPYPAPPAKLPEPTDEE